MSKWSKETVGKDGKQFTRGDLIISLWIGIFLPVGIPVAIYYAIREAIENKKDEKTEIGEDKGNANK